MLHSAACRALKFNLDLVGISEQDPRRGAVDFAKERESAPLHLRTLIDDVEFLPFRRREFEAKAMYAEIIKRGKFEATEEESLPLSGSANLPPNHRKEEAQVPPSQDLTLNPSYKQLSISRVPRVDSPTSAGEESRPAIAGGGGDGLGDGMVLDKSPGQSRARESAKQHAALLESLKRTSTLRIEQRGQVSSVDSAKTEAQRQNGDGDTSESEDDLAPTLVPLTAVGTMSDISLAHGAPKGNAGPQHDQPSMNQQSTLHADV